MKSVEEIRAGERGGLLDELKRRIELDPRVLAAWLHGSIGRKQFDSWSDIDVWLVVTDEAFPEMALGRHGEVAALGEPVLTVEAEQNAPPGGAYLMAGYDLPAGLQLIDWYWQPVSEARAPSNVEVLVSKVELPAETNSGTPPFKVWNPTLEEDAANAAMLGWAMIAIQAKHLIRKPDEELRFQEFIQNLIGHGSGRTAEVRYGNEFDKSARLQAMSCDLERLAPASSRPVDSVRRLLKSVQLALESQGPRS